MQIDAIAKSLKEHASENPMAAALGVAGLAGGVHYGVRASRTALRPFAMLSVAEIERTGHTSGVWLVTYEATLTLVSGQQVSTVGAILATFHRYWDRIAELPDLDPDLAHFLAIHAGTSELGESDEEELGKDVLLGVTTWTIVLSEHSPALV